MAGGSGSRGREIDSGELLDYLADEDNWAEFQEVVGELEDEEKDELQQHFTACNADFDDVGDALWGDQDDYKSLKMFFENTITDDAGRKQFIAVLEEVGLIQFD